MKEFVPISKRRVFLQAFLIFLKRRDFLQYCLPFWRLPRYAEQIRFKRFSERVLTMSINMGFRSGMKRHDANGDIGFLCRRLDHVYHQIVRRVARKTA